jgi:VWFA-related protein
MKALAAALIASALLLQQDGQAPLFRSTTRIISVFATVQGPDGRLVPNLSKQDFLVLDNGKPVEISVFSNDPQPVTAVVMVDVSSSMTPHMPRVTESLHHFVSTLLPGDRIRIGSFGAEVGLSHSLTGDRDTLYRVLEEELWAGGVSPLWRALDVSMTALAAEPGRRVILTLTDGLNYAPGGGSALPEVAGGFDGVKRRAVTEAGVMIYAVGYRDPMSGARLKGDILELTEVTGGGHADVAPDEDLGRAFEEIGKELRQQYVIGFTPTTLDGKVHKLEVRALRSGLKARARTSYLAAGGQ